MNTDFFAAARLIGSDPSLVQGGGGNISVKDGNVMLVKASGLPLKNLAPGKGYASSRHGAIVTYLRRAARAPIERRQHDLEQELNDLVDSTLVSEETFGSPSMEAGMHAVLGKYVFHTHSVYANVLNCMRGGERILQKIFGEQALIMPYHNPGRELAIALARVAQKPAPSIIFLLNHGLITHADTAAAALHAKQRVTAAIEVYLREHRAYEPFQVTRDEADFSRHLFPDSVVYSSADFRNAPDAKRETLYEISSAVNYILKTIKNLGGTPRFLEADDVAFIANMEKEKVRMATVREA